MAFADQLALLGDELRRAGQAFYRSTAEPEATRKVVLLFMANATQCAAEIPRTSGEPIAGWLVVRTLWHNAGCLAFYLFDKRGHSNIAELLDMDSDVRAEQVFIRETRRILGEAEARRLLMSASVSPDGVCELAASAKGRGQSQERWRNVRVADLRNSLKVMGDRFVTRGVGDHRLIRTLLLHADIPRTWGDNVAHPNMFGIRTLLNLVDLDTGVITTDREPHVNGSGLREIATISLMLIHAATLATFAPGFLNFEELVEEASRMMRHCEEA